MSMLPFRVFTLGFSWVFRFCMGLVRHKFCGGGSGGVRVLFGWVVVGCAGCRFGRVFGWFGMTCGFYLQVQMLLLG